LSLVNGRSGLQVRFRPSRISSVLPSWDRIVGSPVRVTLSVEYADKGVQAGEDVQTRMNRMGFERAMDVALDVAQRVRSIQAAQDEVNSIVELLAAQSLLQRVTFNPMVVEDGSESEAEGARLEEVE